MTAVVAPCPSCGLHHADPGACPIGLILHHGMQLALPNGTVVAGRYRILNQAHRSTMSTVYRVVDVARGETAMVLKELVFTALPEAERAEALRWFLREAHLLSTLRHHALPVLHATFSEHDRSYLVMEAVPGPSLETRVRVAPPSEAQVLRWGIEICEVLHFLHSQPEPISYRDLKPANILERADTGELVLVDFGVARYVAPGAIGTAVGTPGYAAPEQYQGLADMRSDIYSLGATLHRLLTGYDPDQEQPFRHPAVRSLRPQVSEATEAIVHRALALAPHARFSTALEMRNALYRVLPATPEALQAISSPFYFWITVLPGVSMPLSLVCYNLARYWLAGQGNPTWSWLCLLLAVYAPALLYAQPLYALRRGRLRTPGPNTTLVLRRARRLLLWRLGLASPFWLVVALAGTGSGLLNGVALLGILGVALCWCLGLWRAGQTPRTRLRQLRSIWL